MSTFSRRSIQRPAILGILLRSVYLRDSLFYPGCSYKLIDNYRLPIHHASALRPICSMTYDGAMNPIIIFSQSVLQVYGLRLPPVARRDSDGPIESC